MRTTVLVVGVLWLCARRDKTEEAHMCMTYLSLVVAAFCSRPRLQGVRVFQSVLVVIRIPGTTVRRSRFSSFSP